MKTTLIVTVDTEEEGLWGGRYPRTGNTVKNIRGVPRLQSLCDRFGVRPTYLVDAPVVEDDEAVELLRGLQDDGRAEIGAHLHPWCNPPYREEVSGDRKITRGLSQFSRRENGTVLLPNQEVVHRLPPGAHASYLCNLPESVQREKLAWLTETIEARFGRRPVSFRAGRYGLDIVGARILAELGYLVDSSVIPFTDYSSDGGPNFEDAPHTPYWIDGDDLRRPHAAGFLLEVPVSVGFNRSDFARAHAIRQAASGAWLRRLRAVGILDRLGIVRKIKFSPEQADARSMKQLVDAYLSQQAPAIVMMFHSSSLVPGYSPYVRSQRELDRFHEFLEVTFDFCLGQRGMNPGTLSTFAEILQTQTDGKATFASRMA